MINKARHGKGKQAFTDTVSRQWALLRRLPRAPSAATVQRLQQGLESEGFAVDRRTLQRDLQSLSRQFAIISDEGSKPYRWSWAKDAPALNLPGLTPSEALAFRLVKQFVEPLLPASVVSALGGHFALAEKALREAPGVLKNWPDKVRIVHPTQLLRRPAIPPKVYAEISDALLQGRQLEVAYGKDGRQKFFSLHPLALVQRGQVAYLVGRGDRHLEPRLFALHRFRRARMLDEPVRDGFDVDAYLAAGALEFGPGGRITLEAIFDREPAAYLRESPLSADQTQTELPGGRVRLTATTSDTRQLRWWLLGFGASVQVVKPEPLRRFFRETIAALAKAYRVS